MSTGCVSSLSLCSVLPVIPSLTFDLHIAAIDIAPDAHSESTISPYYCEYNIILNTLYIYTHTTTTDKIHQSHLLPLAYLAVGRQQTTAVVVVRAALQQLLLLQQVQRRQAMVVSAFSSLHSQYSLPSFSLHPPANVTALGSDSMSPCPHGRTVARSHCCRYACLLALTRVQWKRRDRSYRAAKQSRQQTAATVASSI